jgi:NAD(P)-dependent dehydrogenase (short-subunit alcohol dehydrogenase family)
MKSVVITGSTRGIGYGLADAFLNLGCAVTVSGRTAQAVDSAVARLVDEHGPERILGHPCDVTDFAQLQFLWDATAACFGRVDIWVNNAGIAHAQQNVWDLSVEQVQAVVSTNLVGAFYGSKVALVGMLAQGSGSLYNMEGLGSDGRYVDGLALYGSTKSALRYLDQALAKELRGTPVVAGALRPGMVVTGLLTDQYADRPEDLERAKRIFNILADPVEAVAPWLAEKALANERNGATIRWLPTYKVLFRFLSAPFRKRDPFAGFDQQE